MDASDKFTPRNTIISEKLSIADLTWGEADMTWGEADFTWGRSAPAYTDKNTPRSTIYSDKYQ